MSDITINERIYAEEPLIAGVKVRPYNHHVKLKMARILRWLDLDDADKNEEILFAFIYLIAAPIERVAINTLNRNAYLVDKDAFLETLTSEDLRAAAEWFIEVTNLERETQIEVEPKPGLASSKETPPPNSSSRRRSRA